MSDRISYTASGLPAKPQDVTQLVRDLRQAIARRRDEVNDRSRGNRKRVAWDEGELAALGYLEECLAGEPCGTDYGAPDAVYQLAVRTQDDWSDSYITQGFYATREAAELEAKRIAGALGFPIDWEVWGRPVRTEPVIPDIDGYQVREVQERRSADQAESTYSVHPWGVDVFDALEDERLPEEIADYIRVMHSDDPADLVNYGLASHGIIHDPARRIIARSCLVLADPTNDDEAIQLAKDGPFAQDDTVADDA